MKPRRFSIFPVFILGLSQLTLSASLEIIPNTETFFDPKYHDSSPDQFTKHLAKSSIVRFPDTVADVSEESTKEDEKDVKSSSNKFKRGIIHSVDFSGSGDQLATDSIKIVDQIALDSNRDQIALASNVQKPKPKIMVKVIAKKEIGNDQDKTESKKVKKESVSSATQPQHSEQPGTASNNSHNDPSSTQLIETHTHLYPHYFVNAVNTVGHTVREVGHSVNGLGNEIFRGRNKMKAYYRRKHFFPSHGKVWFEMGSKIGYW